MRRQATLAGEARRLLLPGEMGEMFKVIALGRGYECAASRRSAHRTLAAVTGWLVAPSEFKWFFGRLVNDIGWFSSNSRPRASRLQRSAR